MKFGITFNVGCEIMIMLLLLGCLRTDKIDQKGELTLLNIEIDRRLEEQQKELVELQQISDKNRIVLDGEIKRRGGHSINFPKHSYEIKLNIDYNLAGLPKDDDWILNANYIDKTFLRHVISYELFNDMNKRNIVAATQFVDVAINGTYNGLYVLMEKLDKSSLQIKESDSTVVIFKEPHLFRASNNDIIPQDPNNFHQQTFPKLSKSDKNKTIEDIRNFIIHSNDSDFRNNLNANFDLDNIIDWHLLLLISNNADGILKNFYLYKKDDQTAFRIAPWDYDHSFGRDGDNELNLDERPLDIERSILFKRLLRYDWYKDQLKRRWDTLNNNDLFSVKGLSKRVIKKSKYIRSSAIKNFEPWPVDGKAYFDENGFEQEVDIILQFIELRHKRLSSYFEEL